MGGCPQAKELQQLRYQLGPGETDLWLVDVSAGRQYRGSVPRSLPCRRCLHRWCHWCKMAAGGSDSGFISRQWEGAHMCRPSLFTVWTSVTLVLHHFPHPHVVETSKPRSTQQGSQENFGFRLAQVALSLISSSEQLVWPNPFELGVNLKLSKQDFVSLGKKQLIMTHDYILLPDNL